jgi:hypothetical protein
MARASIPTLLSLDRYAAILGIPPLSFNSGVTPGIADPIFPTRGCSSIWYQYDWQMSDQVSRESLALAISNAETDIARALRYWPAPMFIVEEEHRYPRPFLKQLSGDGTDVRGRLKTVVLDYGRIVATGVREVIFIDDPRVVYSDADSDGYSETATVTVATTVTDICEIKVYFTGHDGEPEWEIRPARTQTLVGGVYTATFWSWQLIDQDNYEVFPTSGGPGGVDVSTTANFVGAVDVYQERVDPDAPAATFYWEATSACCDQCTGAICTHITQSGCASINDWQRGIVSPIPATYDAGWKSATWTNCCEPDLVKVSYYAGEVGNDFKKHKTCDALSNYMAHTIAILATARLERAMCTCGRLDDWVDQLQKDLAVSGQGTGYFMTEEIFHNPFGTRFGEVTAWKQIAKLPGRRLSVAVI